MSTDGKKPKSGALDALLGQRIRYLRREKGMSQTALAEHIGMTFQQVQKYENGANRISATTLVKLAEALDVTAVALLSGLDGAVGGSSGDAQVDQLTAAFARIQSPDLRAAVVRIVSALVEDPLASAETPTRPRVISG
jgi:transcriptional regulator with XRE-family HTH domain